MQNDADAAACEKPGEPLTSATTATAKRKRGPGRSRKTRAKNLMLAADSAIDRLEQMTRPGGEIDSMDIKDLKSLITSIKDLASVSAELQGDTPAGGVIILPEVKTDE